MEILERIKRSINVYVRNDAKAAAIASAITNKDCSAQDLIKTEGFDQALLGILPFRNDKEVNLPTRKFVDAFRQVIKFKKINGILFLLCGPSAVGKDTIASYTNSELYFDRMKIKYLKKYTTRRDRKSSKTEPTEKSADPSSGYTFYKDRNDLLSKNPDAILGYSIYEDYYAFSEKHLLSEESKDKALFCIYGRFEDIDKVKKKVFYEYNRIPFSILMKASMSDLNIRTNNREALTDNEKVLRKDEMEKQVEYIERKKGILPYEFDLILDNGNANSIKENEKKLTNFIKECHTFYDEIKRKI